MCFPDINILCLCVTVLPIISASKEQQSFSCLSLLHSGLWVASQQVQEPAGMSYLMMSSSWLGVMLEQLCSKHWAGVRVERRWPRDRSAKHPHANHRDRGGEENKYFHMVCSCLFLF